MKIIAKENNTELKRSCNPHCLSRHRRSRTLYKTLGIPSVKVGVASNEAARIRAWPTCLHATGGDHTIMYSSRLHDSHLGEVVALDAPEW